MAFNFSGAYARPRNPYDAPPEDNFSPDGSTYTLSNNDVHTNTLPAENGFQSFLGGMQGKNGKRGGILGGLSTLAGGGGAAGGIGGIAKFLL